MKFNQFLSILFAFLLVSACTPKTGEKTTKVEEPKKDIPVKVDEGNCVKWVGKPFQEEAKQNHVLYRQELTEKNYKVAYDYWKKVFDVAPAANGRVDYQYSDGVKIYKGLLETETDPAKKESYIKEIMNLYSQAVECFPAKEAMYKGLKAYDLVYTFPNRVPDEEIFQLFKEVVDIKGKDSPAYVINPFTSLLVNGLLDEKISMSEAQKYAPKILDAIATATKKYKNKNDPKWTSQGWDVVEGYAPARLEQLEGMEGFYDCAYYKNKYFSEYEGNKSDCEVVRSIRGKLNWAKCSPSDPKLAEINATYTANCKKAVSTTTAAPMCRDFMESGNYSQAISCYEEKADASTDNEKKAQYYLFIAKIYYGELKKFSQARKYARKAIQAKPNWGDPYILIGKLYASSGPLCGPGTGWDSQVVTWPAIDKWKKAKQVDPTVAAQANKLINRYEQYMPSKGDIFQRTLKEGGTYKVGCWIQENTIIRAAKK